ncbi:MAG: hypothetical protein AB7F64_05165 [Gammaproteobacteria bacterium]
MPFGFLKKKQQKPTTIMEMMDALQAIRQGVNQGRVTYDEIESHVANMVGDYASRHSLTESDALWLINTLYNLENKIVLTKKENLRLLFSRQLKPTLHDLFEAKLMPPVDLFFLHALAGHFQLSFYIERPVVDIEMLVRQKDARIAQQRQLVEKQLEVGSIQLLQQQEFHQLQIIETSDNAAAQRALYAQQIQMKEQQLMAARMEQAVVLSHQSEMDALHERQAQLEQQESIIEFNRAYLAEANSKSLTVYREKYPSIASQLQNQMVVFDEALIETRKEFGLALASLNQLVNEGLQEIGAKIEMVESKVEEVANQMNQLTLRHSAEAAIVSLRNLILMNPKYLHVAESYSERKILTGDRELSLDSAINLFLDNDDRCVILNAPIGFGKTYSGLNLVYKKNQESSKIISLYLDCLEGAYDFSTNFVRNLIKGYGVNEFQMQEMAEKYQLLIFLDNLNPTGFLKVMGNMQLAMWKHLKFICAGSETLVAQKAAAASRLMSVTVATSTQPVSEIKLLPFDQAQIRKFLESVLTQTQINQLMDQYQQDKDFRELLAYPLFLREMAVVCQKGVLSKNALLDQLIERWIERQISKLASEINHSIDSADLKSGVLACAERIAFQLRNTGASQIPVPQRKTSLLFTQVHDRPSTDQFADLFNQDEHAHMIRFCLPWKKENNHYSFLLPIIAKHLADRYVARGGLLTQHKSASAPIINVKKESILASEHTSVTSSSGPRIFNDSVTPSNQQKWFDFIKNGKVDEFKKATCAIKNATELRDERGYTLLHVAAEYGSTEIADFLVNNLNFTGAELVEGTKSTPLMIARDKPASRENNHAMLSYLRGLKLKQFTVKRIS